MGGLGKSGVRCLEIRGGGAGVAKARKVWRSQRGRNGNAERQKTGVGEQDVKEIRKTWK